MLGLLWIWYDPYTAIPGSPDLQLALWSSKCRGWQSSVYSHISYGGNHQEWRCRKSYFFDSKSASRSSFHWSDPYNNQEFIWIILPQIRNIDNLAAFAREKCFKVFWFKNISRCIKTTFTKMTTQRSWQQVLPVDGGFWEVDLHRGWSKGTVQGCWPGLITIAMFRNADDNLDVKMVHVHC